VVLAQCVCFLWPSVLEEYRKSTALCFLILTPTDGVCLADRKGSMLELGQFSKVSQVYTVLHQQVPLTHGGSLQSKIRAFPSRSTEWY